MSYPRTRQLATRPLAFIFYFLFSIFCASSTFALDPSLDISQYAHTSWKVRDGFVPGEINSITQTPDGYLWLGTDFGLYRFDGVRAVPWQPRDGQQLPRDRIHRLLVARDGTLWISMLHGLASWKDGKLTKYPEVAGSIVTDLLEDHDGTIWFGVIGPGRLCAVRGGKVECFGAGSLGPGVFALYEDSKGNLWVSTSTGVWRWAPGVPEQYPFSRTRVEVNSLVEDDGGSVLLATNEGAKRLAGGRIRDYALPIVGQEFRPSRFFRSSDGSLWIGGDQGLLHVYQTHADTFGTAEGLSGDSATSIFEDREGNVWVSTLNGLDRFREYAIPAVSRNQGLSTTDCHAIQATFDRTVWISTSNGLNAWHNGHVSVYGSRTEPRRFSKTIMQNRGELTSSPRSLGLDNQGHLYVSTVDGIFYFASDHFVRVPGAPGGNIWSITGDAHGKLWVVDGEAGLFYFAPGEAVEPIPWARFGQKSMGPEALLPDRFDGGVWLGFNETGIAYFRDGEVRVSYTGADGLGNGRVNDLRFDSHSTLWAATDGGLSRIKDGHVLTLTSKNGLPCDTVHWSIEDDDQFVWLYMACGLVRITRLELDAWAINPERSVQMTVFDASDGVSTVAVASGYRPLLTKSPDSKIWFVTTEGVSVIDPRHLPYNTIPPPVHIEQVTADGKTYDAANGVRLPRLVRYVDIDYTALSLVVPEKVRFRVKLEGEDKDWRELVNVRRVSYTNLGPKHYRFLVKACNNSGVWNQEGAALDFVIPPAWYQTYWFLAACVAAFLALLWALYQYRLHQLAQQFNMRLEERVGERTRIARDLHDTLLQTFQGLVFRFQAARIHLPDRPEEASEALDSALFSADHALAEGRSAIKELRSEPLKETDMEHMLLGLGREMASAQNGRDSAPALRVIVEGTRRAKRANIREEIYRIARELLRNAYRHAHARSVEAELRYYADAFVLIVRDDGKGIDAQVLKDRGRAGHWGLSGMYERAEGIGARLDIWSEAGAGTEARLTIPGAIAYEKSGHSGRFKLFRKMRIHEHRS